MEDKAGERKPERGKDLPSDVHAERLLLACSLENPGRYWLDLQRSGFTRDYFHGVDLQVLYSAMGLLYDRGGTIDPVELMGILRGTLVSELPMFRPYRGRPDAVLADFCPASVVGDLMVSLETTSGWEQWKESVVASHRARQNILRLQVVVEDMMRNPKGGLESLDQLTNELVQENVAMARGECGGVCGFGVAAPADAAELAHRTYAMLRERRAGGGSHGLSWGVNGMDGMYRLQDGHLIVLAARPSMGKSALSSLVALRAAQAGTGVLTASLEMPEEEMMMRYFGIHGRVNMKTCAEGLGCTDERIQEIAGELAQLGPLLQCTDKIRSLPKLLAEARAAKMNHNIGLLIVDYLQLINVEGGRSENEEVNIISRSLKNLALELRIPVLALSQLNRGVEHRGNPVPRLSDLRSSGGIEQDADTVVFIGPNEKDESGNYRAGGSMFASFAKVRGGSVGMVPLNFHGPHTLFEDPYVRQQQMTAQQARNA